jgi:hypothetical protein
MTSGDFRITGRRGARERGAVHVRERCSRSRSTRVETAPPHYAGRVLARPFDMSALAPAALSKRSVERARLADGLRRGMTARGPRSQSTRKESS